MLQTLLASCTGPLARSLRTAAAWATLLATAALAGAAEPVFPAEHWQEKSPADLGLDPERLDAVAAALGGRGCLVKDGYVIKTWGSQSEVTDWFSSAKPVLSTLLMFAIQEGKVAGVDARIAEFGWELREKDRPMTFRHLGAMTSGYARPEPPGAAWSYNDYAIQLYQQTLFDRVYRESPETVVTAPIRFGALRLEDGLKFRQRNRRISASVRDFARIAWLWANRGRWGERQLIRRELFDQCAQPQVPADLPNTVKASTDDYLHIGTYGGDSDHFSQAGPGIYGFNWWFNAPSAAADGKPTWPDAPADTFMSLGLHGNCTAMMPSLGLVVASADGDWGPIDPGRADSVMNQRLRLIAHAGQPVTAADQGTPPTAAASKPADHATTVSGTLRKWQPVTITFRGPQASEAAGENPFLDYRLDVTFRIGTRSVSVPGYFAADGDAAESGANAGDRWRVHFVPDEAGEWTWRAAFCTGRGAAIADAPLPGDPLAFHGETGKFLVGPVDTAAAGFYAQGRLRYVGRRYLQFAESGRYFLKNGVDSPENLLAYVDFDDTRPTHRYGPHRLDARPDDPTWRGGRGRNVLGAMNYLASKGINSIYFLPMNVRGDGKDVWPWTTRDERFRFDVSKLDQWERVFAHLDALGIGLHVVLAEQENDQLLDGGGLGPERRLFHRELIARFAHHLSVVWNLGEENTNTFQQRQDFARHLHALDPYDNPVVLHTFPKQQKKVYEPLLGFEFLEGVSLQTNDTVKQTREWITRSASAGRPWVVSLDEIGPADTGVKPDAVDFQHDEVRREHLWPHFMSGGAGVEWLFGYKYAHNDINLEDFRSRDHMWDLTRYAVDFFQQHLPFAEMDEARALTAREDDFCLAKPDEVYALYLPHAEMATAIELGEGTFRVQWYNPRRGGQLKQGGTATVTGPGRCDIGAPPGDAKLDWACVISK
ncbi:MAG: DUF5060 domain-containing protein [Pirellulales bacterium]